MVTYNNNTTVFGESYAGIELPEDYNHSYAELEALASAELEQTKLPYDEFNTGNICVVKVYHGSDNKHHFLGQVCGSEEDYQLSVNVLAEYKSSVGLANQVSYQLTYQEDVVTFSTDSPPINTGQIQTASVFAIKDVIVSKIYDLDMELSIQL